MGRGTCRRRSRRGTGSRGRTSSSPLLLRRPRRRSTDRPGSRPGTRRSPPPTPARSSRRRTRCTRFPDKCTSSRPDRTSRRDNQRMCRRCRPPAPAGIRSRPGKSCNSRHRRARTGRCHIRCKRRKHTSRSANTRSPTCTSNPRRGRRFRRRCRSTDHSRLRSLHSLPPEASRCRPRSSSRRGTRSRAGSCTGPHRPRARRGRCRRSDPCRRRRHNRRTGSPLGSSRSSRRSPRRTCRRRIRHTYQGCNSRWARRGTRCQSTSSSPRLDRRCRHRRAARTHLRRKPREAGTRSPPRSWSNLLRRRRRTARRCSSCICRCRRSRLRTCSRPAETRRCSRSDSYRSPRRRHRPGYRRTARRPEGPGGGRWRNRSPARPRTYAQQGELQRLATPLRADAPPTARNIRRLAPITTCAQSSLTQKTPTRPSIARDARRPPQWRRPQTQR